MSRQKLLQKFAGSIGPAYGIAKRKIENDLKKPGVGQQATQNGKPVVYSGENYGYQSPASHQKLKEEGKFRAGTQALDRISSSAGRAVRQHAPAVAQHFDNIKADQQRSAAAQDRAIRNTAGNRVANALQQDATDNLLNKASKATNVDRRIVGATAATAQAAIGKAAYKGAASSNLTPRSVGAAARADVAGTTGRRIYRPAVKGAVTPSGKPVSGRTAPYKITNGEVLPPRPGQTRASSSPGIARRITKEQAQANAAKAAKASPSSTPNRGLTSGGTTAKNAGQKAAGPRFSGSDGKGIAPGNTYTKEAPSDTGLTRSLKEKAATNYGKKTVGKDLPADPPKQNKREFPRSTRLDAQANNSGRNRQGWNAENSRNARLELERNRGNAYQPNRGRVNPRKAVEYRNLEANARSEAGKGLRGTARDQARGAAQSEARAKVKAAEQEAKAKAQVFQQRVQKDSIKGTTPSARKKMSEDVTNRPKTKLKPTNTTTTGTRRAAANPNYGVSTSKGADGEVRQALGTTRGVQSRDLSYTRNAGKPNETRVSRSAQVRPANDPSTPSQRTLKPVQGGAARGTRSARTLDPNTGRPYRLDANGKAVTNKPSPNRKRGSNPADNFPSRPGRAKMEGEFPNRAGGSPIKANQTKLADDRKNLKPGLTVTTPQKAGQPYGGTGLKGTSPQDTKQRRNGKKVGRLGLPNSRPSYDPNTNQSSVLPRRLSPSEAAQLKKEALANARLRATNSAAATPSNRSENLDRMRAQRAQARADKRAGRVTGRDSKSVQASVAADYNNRLPVAPGTNRRGEVRMQGSKKGNQYVTGINSYQDPKGRIPKSGVHDGAPTRVVGKAKNDSRSAEALAQTKETMEKVRIRNILRARRNHTYRPGVKKPLQRQTRRNQVNGSRARGLQALLKAFRAGIGR
jgi:hypothetical protein